MHEPTQSEPKPVEALPPGIKAVTKVYYSSDLADKFLFATPNEAVEFERLLVRVREAASILDPSPKEKGQKVSHDPNFARFKAAVEAILLDFDRPGFHILNVLKVDPLGASVLLSCDKHGPRGEYAAKLCHRLACMDTDGNEYYTPSDVPADSKLPKKMRMPRKNPGA
jgi:hypothetical protein